MTIQTKGRIHLVYGILLSVLILTAGVCFALSCVSIYRSGDPPFTRESIAAHFDRFAPLVYVTLGGIVGGIILAWVLPRRDLVIPEAEDDPLDVIVERYHRGLYRPVKDPATVLKRLLARIDEEELSHACRASLAKERRVRRIVGISAAALSAGAMVPAFVWCCNVDHFSINWLSEDIKTAALFVIPCAVVALGSLVGATLLRRASFLRETALVKAAIAEQRGKTVPAKNASVNRKDLLAKPLVLWGIRGLILVAGILCILLGIFNGGMADVLGKAIRICTECIGLG